MNELISMVFKNEQFGSVRIIQNGEKPKFAGIDVAAALEYKEPKNAIRQHCKHATTEAVQTEGGVQDMLVITEGDVYRLIVRSKMPEAQKFEEWLFDKLLPEIRKNDRLRLIIRKYTDDEYANDKWIEQDTMLDFWHDNYETRETVEAELREAIRELEDKDRTIAGRVKMAIYANEQIYLVRNAELSKRVYHLESQLAIKSRKRTENV